jgi:hypothetical protein
MSDPKVGEWFAVEGAGAPLPYFNLKTTALQQVVEVFLQNTKLAISISGLPSRLHYFGKRLQLAQIAANMMLFNDPHYERFDMPGDKIEEYIQLVERLLSGETEGPFKIEISGVTTSHLYGYFEEPVKSAYETMMRSQIILIWSAFETLAGDLWETALNCHPKELSQLKNNQTQPQNSQKDKSDGKSIKTWILEDYDYDLSSHMGTVLRDRFTFQSLKIIQEAYLSAFPTSCGVGRASFWQDPSLKAVCALRNVIVHRAGVIDKQFMDTKGDWSRIDHLKEGDLFVPDGIMLQFLFREFFQFCQLMVESVDGWLAAN